MQNWDDLKFFLAVARAGSLTAASEILAVNQSTVSRRISGFEQELKVRLFERFSTGYVLTPEGEELLHRAERIEEESHAIERHVMGRNVELSGPIRVTCSLAIARYFLIPLLKRFNKMHPGIVVHLDLSSSLHNLTAREADVAIRVTRDAIPETLIGRELGQIDYTVYGRDDYVTAYYKHNAKEPLHWIGEDNNQDRPNWLPTDTGPLQLVMRSNNVIATLDLIKQGLGVGRLPCFMGEKESTLQQLDFQHTIPSIPVWMLTHADMRRVNRVSVFTAFVVEEFRKQMGYHIQ
jgi:DNA-binding transcriptional LysR family regulator